MNTLLEKIHAHDAQTAVIGQGYVGLQLAMALVDAGFPTLGVDVDTSKIADLREGRSPVMDIPDERVREAVDGGRFEPTAEYERVGEADAVFVCVPTPLSKTQEPDLSYIRAAAEKLHAHLEPPCLVVLESTTYPGTTEDVLVPLLLGDRFELDEDVFVAFSPERVDPGNRNYGVANTPKVVGGVTEAAGALVEALYGDVVGEVHRVANATESEMVKLLENTFRAVNIALVNEMAVMCDRMDIDIWNVIDAASTKPFGFMPFRPGPGIGGNCIPLDPMFLAWKAKTCGFHNRFIELANDVNTDMPRFVVERLARLFDERHQSLNGSRVLLAGMAYKPDVDDLRESPGLDIWTLLEKRGVEVSYHDPHVDRIEQFDARSQPLSPETLEGVDAVVIVTDHEAVDYEVIERSAELVFDTRNALGGGVDRL